MLVYNISLFTFLQYPITYMVLRLVDIYVPLISQEKPVLSLGLVAWALMLVMKNVVARHP